MISNALRPACVCKDLRGEDTTEEAKQGWDVGTPNCPKLYNCLKVFWSDGNRCLANKVHNLVLRLHERQEVVQSSVTSPSHDPQRKLRFQPRKPGQVLCDFPLAHPDPSPKASVMKCPLFFSETLRESIPRDIGRKCREHALRVEAVYFVQLGSRT